MKFIAALIALAGACVSGAQSPPDVPTYSSKDFAFSMRADQKWVKFDEASSRYKQLLETAKNTKTGIDDVARRLAPICDVQLFDSTDKMHDRFCVNIQVRTGPRQDIAYTDAASLAKMIKGRKVKNIEEEVGGRASMWEGRSSRRDLAVG